MLAILPYELLAKIFQHLLDDPKSYRNLSRTCKKFCYAANHPVRRTPYSFCLNTHLESFSEIHCDTHGQCPDLVSRYQCKCEQQLACEQNLDNTKCPEVFNIDASSCCYYHRLHCMMSAKYTTFSAIVFEDRCLKDLGCLTVLNDFSGSFKLRALVELRLHDCNATLKWLDNMLNYLTHLEHLILEDVYFQGDDAVATPENPRANLRGQRRPLRSLLISGPMCSLNDSEFRYFLEKCPAEELNLITARIQCHPIVVRRFYGRNANELDLVTRPSDHVLSINMVYLYLRRHKDVVKSFMVDAEELSPEHLRRILDDEELKGIHISVWPTRYEHLKEYLIRRAMLTDEDLMRVTFVPRTCHVVAVADSTDELP